MQTTRFLITGVGGQGTILASDVLAEVGLRLGYDAKKSDILGLAVRGGSVVSHIIWGDKVRAPMIDEGSADYYISFEWLEGLRRMAYTNPDTVIPAVEGIRNPMRERCAALHVLPATPMAVDMGNARVFNSIIMGKLSLLVGGDGDVWRSAVADTVAPKVRDLNVRAFDAGRSFGL